MDTIECIEANEKRKKKWHERKKNFSHALNIYSCEKNYGVYFSDLISWNRVTYEKRAHGIHFGISFIVQQKHFFVQQCFFFNVVFVDVFLLLFFFASFFLFHSNITTSIAKVLGKRKCTSFLKSARKIQSVNNYFKYSVFVVRLFLFSASKASYLEREYYC